MSLAEACLVRLSELHSDCQVFTLNADFRRYRRHGRQVKVRNYRCQVIWVMRRWLKEWRERRPTKRALEAIAACKAELDVIERLC